MYDKNVYILGAGFSSDEGAPLLSPFLQVARRLYLNPTSGLTEWDKPHFERLFAYRHQLAGAREAVEVDLEHVEHLLGILDLEAAIDRTKENIRDDLVFVILRTLDLTINWARVAEPPVAGKTPSLPQLLVHHLAEQDSVITFNYDVQVDLALALTGSPPRYALSAEGTREPLNRITLLKLHGSANWFMCHKCGHLNVMAVDSSSSFASWLGSPCEKCRTLALRPLIVPPGLRKPGGDDLLVPVWRTAVQELRDAQRLVIIGYSMPESDVFFRYLMALGMNMEAIDLVVVIDPDKRVGERYENLFDKVFRERHFRFASSRARESLSAILQSWANRPWRA